MSLGSLHVNYLCWVFLAIGKRCISFLLNCNIWIALGVTLYLLNWNIYNFNLYPHWRDIFYGYSLIRLCISIVKVRNLLISLASAPFSICKIHEQEKKKKKEETIMYE